MSAERDPYQEEIAQVTCETCPLRELTEAQLSEMAQGEEPYYLADMVTDAQRMATGAKVLGDTGVRTAFEFTYDRLPFSLDGSNYRQLSDMYGEVAGTDEQLVYEQHALFGGETISETSFLPQPRALLACLRRAKAGECDRPRSKYDYDF